VLVGGGLLGAFLGGIVGGSRGRRAGPRGQQRTGDLPGRYLGWLPGGRGRFGPGCASADPSLELLAVGHFLFTGRKQSSATTATCACAPGSMFRDGKTQQPPSGSP
jgi:hypothetical protein